MSYVTTADGCRLFYRIDGPPGAPVLLLSNSLGTTNAMWDAQAAAFAGRFRVLRYDSRGHGQSQVPPGPYTIERLAADVIDVLDACGVERAAAFCGLSLGGMVGQSIGVRFGARFERLVLANTAAYMGPPQTWDERIDAVRSGGMAALRDSILTRWFTPAFRHAAPAAVERIGAMLDATDPAGYAVSCAAIRDMDQRALLASIALPALVIVGREDSSTPPAAGEAIAAAIPGAQLVALDAAHLSNVESEAEFNAALAGFLQRRSDQPLRRDRETNG